jgi:delta1-piperideine-2-carboxylate reductase
VIAINPDLVAGPGWDTHSGKFFDRLEAIDGVRMPGERRHKNRLDIVPRQINKELLKKLRELL